jgi:phosphomannomutase
MPLGGKELQDIRGIAGTELSAQFSEKLGKAIATHLDAKTVSVVRDIRESGPEYHAAFVKGLISAGANCV